MRLRNRFVPALLAAGLIAASGGACAQTQPFQPTYEEGVARRGQDYRSFQPTGPSALYCQQACLAEPQCHAWAYDGGKQPTCWLKSGVPAPVNARGIVSGVVRPDAAPQAGGAGAPIDRIVYRTYSPPQHNGALTRMAGGEWMAKWVDTNNQAGSANFQPISEATSEIVLYDRNRDLYIRLDLAARKGFFRKQANQDWTPSFDILEPGAAAVVADAQTAEANAPAPPAAANKPFVYRRSVTSGVDSPLAYERSWDANCQALSLQVTITQQPANGAIWAIEGTSTIPASTPRGGSTGACAGKSVLGNELFYRSNAGFHGEDSAAYELTYANGRRQTISVVIDVKDAQAAAQAAPQAAPQGRVLSCSAASGQEARCTSHARIDGQHHEWAVSVDVTTQPAHGKVITRIAEEPLKFNDGHSETAHATVIFYQSNPGYTGQDSFIYQRRTDDARDSSNGTVTMNVTVK